MATAQESTCAGHPGIGEELSALVLAALDRIGPVLDRFREEQAPPGRLSEGTCAFCPVCAVLAALRGERPELAARLAEQAAGLVAVLRAALEEGAPAAADQQAESAPPSGRRVQHIRVDRC
jgi:hypothetical protein